MFSIDYKNVKMKKIYVLNVISIENLKNPKISYIFEKALVLSTIYSKCGNKDKKYLKKKSIEILKKIFI